MKRFNALAVASLVFVITVISGGPGDAAPLLFDDFNDNSLDSTLWRTELNIPQGGAAVSETNQRVEMMNRGHLVTQQEFAPSSYANGITITGEWTFASPDDIFSVATRSSSIPSPSAYGVTTAGIEFSVWMGGGADAGVMRIGNRSNGDAIASAAIGSELLIQAGDTFEFLVFDDGTNVSFTMTEVVGSHLGSTSTVSGVDSTAFASNYIEFYNREIQVIQHTAYLDNARVIPEPSTALLLGLGLVGMAARRRV